MEHDRKSREDPDHRPLTTDQLRLSTPQPLNEFLKEHRTVEELKKEIAALTTTVKEQASQIQKVSAELQVRKSAPEVVANNQ